jgi:single-strand DNA-binding protein
MSTTDAAARHHNEVLLVGQLQDEPAERTLSSGEDVVTFRLKVARPAEGAGGGSDSLECTVRGGRARRAATSWSPGDLVEAAGSLRKLFHKTPNGLRPFLVVEVDRARRLGRA